MDALAKFVADAVLGVDTLWGGDVMCASGTGRFIADSWFSDEPLPAAYTVPAAARVRESGGVCDKKVDRQAWTTTCVKSISRKPSPEFAPKPRSPAACAANICKAWRYVWKRCGTLPWKCSAKASPFPTSVVLSPRPAALQSRRARKLSASA